MISASKRALLTWIRHDSARDSVPNRGPNKHTTIRLDQIGRDGQWEDAFRPGASTRVPGSASTRVPGSASTTLGFDFTKVAKINWEGEVVSEDN